MSLVRLDYDRLCSDYEAGLIDNLRGFSVDETAKGGSLALWVPDADLSRSVRNLVEAVVLDGATSVEISFDPQVSGDGSAEVLRTAVSHMGVATAERTAGRLLLRVTGLSEHDTGQVAVDLAARTSRKAEQDARARQKQAVTGDEDRHRFDEPLTAVAPIYAAAVAAVDLADLPHEQTRDSETEGEDGVVRGRVSGVELTLAMDADHTIRRARFSGARSDVERALLDRFCALVEGLPILEASDHGAIRLEFAMRGDPSKRPVMGIVTPFSVDRAFGFPNALIRSALAQYRETSAFGETRNFFDVQPSQDWLALDDGQRRQRLSSVFDAAAERLGLPAGVVAIQEIDYDVRVTVEFVGELNGADKQQVLMALERAMKDSIDERLELFQGELKDSNTIRRLS